MLSFLGGVVGKALASVLTTLLGWFGIYRAGEKAQSQKDQVATLNTIERERQADSTLPKDKQEALEQLGKGEA